MTMNITRKDAIKTLHELWRETNDSWYKEVFNMAIDALSESSGDLISRADAVKCVGWGDSVTEVINRIKSLPSAEVEPTVIRSRTLMPTKDFMEWAKRIKETNPNAIVIPCDAEIVSAEAETDEENELKFYYVESIDDYWVGRRLDNFYYANWHNGLGFVWSHSRYLPWGEHIVDENTLWKEHTYPSEPIEIPFTEWVVGFVKKYFTEPKTAEGIPCSERLPKAEYGESDCVLTTCCWKSDTQKRWIEKLYFDGGNWCYPTGERFTQKVIAWKPLPDPYREDGESNV